MIRDDIKAATITAMKAKEKERTAALRQMSAKIKDRDIEERTSGKDIDDDALVTSVLQKMAKQRRESIEMYEQGGRAELAAAEAAELAVIEEFLPKPLANEELENAVETVVEELEASTLKDLGKCMSALKARYPGKIDSRSAGKAVRKALQ